MKRLHVAHSALKLIAVGAFLIASAAPRAESGSVQLAPYTLEIEPIMGTLLPYDIWGTTGTMKTFGVRASYVMSAPDGALESGILYHTAGSDNAYVIDASWRQEINADLLMAYFTVGMQYSKWNLKVDYEADGTTCIPTNCKTDSGSQSGFKIGAGVQLPLGPMTPLKLGMIFYHGPQLLLLLEAGVGIRY